jgi:hypothetical protein
MSHNLCECNKLEEHLKMRCVYTMPGHACDLLVLVDGTLFRINNPGTYYCHKCGEMTWARLFANAAVYKLYYEGKFIWSAIPSEVEGSASCVHFNIIEVPNFGHILRPLKCWSMNFIIYLPDVTVILPKSAPFGEAFGKDSAPFGEAFGKDSAPFGEAFGKDSAPFGEAFGKDSAHARTLHYVVNTLEAGAVGIFNRGYGVKASLYSEYIAINENGKLIKMQELSPFRPVYNQYGELQAKSNGDEYYCDYGKIVISRSGDRAEFIGHSSGQRTKAAARTDDQN